MSKTEPIKAPCPYLTHQPIAYTATGRCVECTDVIAATSPFTVETRDQAHARGGVKYYTGKVCVNGHISQRYVSSGICIGCSTMNSGKYQKAQRSKFKTGRVTLKVEVFPDDVVAIHTLVASLKQARALQGGAV